MRVFRTILALAIAASLALMPLGGSAVAGPMSSGDAHFDTGMGGSTDMSMDDCCPDDMQDIPGHSGSDKCGMAVCCIVWIEYLHTCTVKGLNDAHAD